MARSLGCIEYRDGTRRFFIHCETAGAIFSPLFESAQTACDTYRQVDVEGLGKIASTDRAVQVVKFVLMSGWQLNPEKQNFEFHRYGLATQDAFLWPHETGAYVRPIRRLLIDGAQTHVSEEVDGGFGGSYDAPICDLGSAYVASAVEMGFEEGFGKAPQLCPQCIETLLG
ncbi:hypothetical protein [Burkholderia sp. Ac-20365]|uniref:hypothetical protein n=1 Tax=Burkholderia sp. Ac-20365 TaxID=2703897 RepID=UPI00197B5426|nr:hypothetical protein [Burkholderia sp. Ac-20365]MBN3761210.1 hypothetical protein [Burkholderia sp. Ac-20365]